MLSCPAPGSSLPPHSPIVGHTERHDAFAVGVLHAHLAGGNARAMAESGLALTCLKHSLPGDASCFRSISMSFMAAGSTSGAEGRIAHQRLGKRPMGFLPSRVSWNTTRIGNYGSFPFSSQFAVSVNPSHGGREGGTVGHLEKPLAGSLPA